MKRNLILATILLFLICLINHKVIAQSFQPLYAKTVQFEYNGAGIILQPGMAIKGGSTTVTIPDGTGTIVTSYTNFSYLMTSLKALDAAHGSHSGINWTSFGY